MSRCSSITYEKTIKRSGYIPFVGGVSQSFFLAEALLGFSSSSPDENNPYITSATSYANEIYNE